VLIANDGLHIAAIVDANLWSKIEIRGLTRTQNLKDPHISDIYILISVSHSMLLIGG